MGIFDWFKYSKLIVSAEGKFQDIYNFDVPLEKKTFSKIAPLAMTILCEEARINKLLPDQLKAMMSGLRGSSPFTPYIIPAGRHAVDWDAYKAIYSNFVSNRAKGIRPIVSMMIAFASMEGGMNDSEIEEVIQDYENNPFFGLRV